MKVRNVIQAKHGDVGHDGKAEGFNLFLKEEFDSFPLEFLNEFTATGPVPLHDHNIEEIFYVVEGHGYVVIGETRYPVGEGDYIYTPPMIPHSIAPFGDRIRCFCFAVGKED